MYNLYSVFFFSYVMGESFECLLFKVLDFIILDIVRYLFIENNKNCIILCIL